MKEGVYDTDAYLQKVNLLRTEKPDAEHYRPLKNLTRFLFFSILFAILTAVSQLTLGLLHCWITVSISLLLAIVTVVLLVRSLMLVNDNLKCWFEFEEQKRTQEGKK